MDLLIRYLKDIATLECQRYSQDRLIERLHYQVSHLGIPTNYQKPELRVSYSEIPIHVLCLFGFPVSVFLWLWIVNTFFPEGSLKGGPIVLTLLIPIVVIMAVGIFLPYIVVVRIRDKKSATALFQKDLAQYNTLVQQDSLRVNQELIIKQELEKQIHKVSKEIIATEDALKSLYSLDIIHPKYQHMVAISSFYDYFDTGRCLSFTGPGGAYDTYEYDVKLGAIVTKLDVIIDKLDEIIANQQMLGDLMRDANNTLARIEQANSRMMNSMSRIEENTELTEYNTRCAMHSTAVMEHIMVYNTLRNR